jgi:BirA family biotin operon repressor/biotin-[acetyl-CoA-carboxylase] ligase
VTGFLARHQRFDSVASTNDVIREWLAEGTAEVCLAVAGEQTAGRGRAGRSWIAPPGTGLLLSLGFRPTWLEPDQAWRLPATVSLAMAGAAEELAGLAPGQIRLKWPNDLVVDTAGTGPRKLAGLLGETQGLGTADPCVVVGLGINTDWRDDAFPPELADSMTSLHQASGGRPIDPAALLAAFLERLGTRIEELRDGRFDGAEWQDRQLTTGRLVRLEQVDRSETLRALGVDAASGALVVEAPGVPGGRRNVLVGEITHVRLANPIPAGAVV